MDTLGPFESLPGNPEARILIVDSDYTLRRILHTALFNAGFDVAEAASGEEALALAQLIRYDVAVVNLRVPRRIGIETCRELRRHFRHLAIFVGTGSVTEDETVEAFEAGADDCISEPFKMRELTARLRAAIRRVKTQQGEPEAPIRIGEIELDPARHLVYKAKVPVHLTPKEFDVLHYLMAHAGMPVTHGRLLSAIWGPERVNYIEYLRTFIRQLRVKLEDATGSPKYILTVGHIGYRFLSNDHKNI